MHFVIMGCGRVGAALALNIQNMGHTVAIIDQDPRAFRRLGEEFKGTTVTGVGFDREVLQLARIEEAYAFAAVSSGDNSNVLAARVARENFGVHHVVARIYDPRRAEIYERLGIATVASVRWAAEQVFRRMIPGNPHREFQDVSGMLSLIELRPDSTWVGTSMHDIEIAAQARVVYVTRHGDGLMLPSEALLQAGDVLHLMVRTEEMEAVEVQFAHRKPSRSQDS